MTNKHNHNHCTHEHLQYCIHCKVVHCLECKQEFPEQTIVTVEKIVYKDRWASPPVITWEGSNELVRAVSDKAVWDKDRFEQKVIAGDSTQCDHRC